jgi:hypothetical protein
MPHLRERSLVFWCFSLVVLLSGCSAKPECDSIETRSAVLQSIQNDHRNALVDYAAKHSNAQEKLNNASSEAEKSAAKPLYRLGEKIVTTSTSEDKRTLKCSGGISVTVGDTKASKEVNFTVQQSSDGKIAVSVEPFQF